MDVLSASIDDHKIAWHENLGDGTFGLQQVITTSAKNARSVYAADLDGDDDIDVLSASNLDDKIAWYENLGDRTFGLQQVISTLADGAYSVYAADLNGDGDMDVLSASNNDGKIAWYENLGGGAFDLQQVITTAARVANCVRACDLDGDGDIDVLSASVGGKVAWYENLGSGVFGAHDMITASVSTAFSVHAADLNGDGDMDVLSASRDDDKIAWYENLGGGVFSSQRLITTSADGAASVCTADLDGDGDLDVLSASIYDDKIAWYENLSLHRTGTTPGQRNRSGYYEELTLNDVLTITGQVYVDPDMTVHGTGTLSVGGIDFCTGGFHFPGTSITATMNDALSMLEIAGMKVYIDRLTLIDNGVRIEGAIAWPNDMAHPENGGINVDFSGTNYIDVTTSGIVYDMAIMADKIDLGIKGFEFNCQEAELLLSNTTGSVVGHLTGQWDIDILGTPINVNLAESEGNYFRFDAGRNEWDLVGQMTVGKITFAKNFYTDGFYIAVDTETHTYEGAGSIRLPVGKGDGVTVLAHAGILNGNFDSAGIEVQDMDVLVWDKPPIYLDTLGGDVWHLAPDPPDTKIEVNAGLQLGPDMPDGSNLLYLDLNGWLDLGGGIGGDARLTVGKREDPIVSGGTYFEWYWAGDAHYTIGGDVIVGKVSNPYLQLNGELTGAGDSITGKLSGSIHKSALPDSIEWLADLAGVPDTIQVDTYMQVVKDADATNDFILAGPKDWFAIRVDLVDDFKLTRNVHKVGYDELEPYVSKGLSATVYQVPEGRDSAMFELTWESGEADLAELTAPDGTVYTAANADSYPGIHYAKFVEERKAIFYVEDPAPGQWQVIIDDSTVDADYALTASVEGDVPTVAIIEPALDSENTTINITWTDDDSDSDATISLFYDTDREGVNGVLIASGISEDDPLDAFTWDTTGVPTGDYYVYAMIDDGVNMPDISYSTGRVSVVDPLAPAAPTGLAAVDVVGAADDSVQLVWDAVADVDLDHYLIRYTSDATGEFYESAVSPGDATSVVLDGLVADTTYRAMVAAIDADGHVSTNAEPIVFTIGAAANLTAFAVPDAVYQQQVPGDPADAYTAIALPQGATMDASGAITWNVPSDAVGWHEMLVHVTDTTGDTNVWRRFVLVDQEGPSLVTGESPTVDARGEDSLTFSVPMATDMSGIPWYGIERDGTAIGVLQQSRIFTDSGLSPNTTYDYTVLTEDNTPSQTAAPATIGPFSLTTAAAVPGVPTLDNPTEGGFELVGLAADGNPVGTAYAILCAKTDKYLAQDGSQTTAPQWQTADAWAGTVVTGLAPDTLYELRAVACNAEGVETDFGPAAQIATDHERILPTVTGVTVVNRRGVVEMTFSEPLWLFDSDVELLYDSGHPVSTDGILIDQPTDSMSAIIDLSGIGLSENTDYMLRLRGDIVQDFSTNLLDGEYFGTFPSGDGQAGGDFEFPITIPDVIQGRNVFYNNSAFDGNNPASDQQDDDAVATDKTALLPGQPATFANYMSYEKGINGIMVDIVDPPATLTLNDFEFLVGNDTDIATWATALAPLSIKVREGAGDNASDRITLTWPDNTIQNTWLQVTVLATANTGLAQPDIFYFGNAIGETGNSVTDARVNAIDALLARNNPRTLTDPAPIDFPYDFNRDQRVNATDMLIARNNQTHFLNALKLITVPDGKTAVRLDVDAAFADEADGTLHWLYELEDLATDRRASDEGVEVAVDLLLAGV